MEERKGMRKPSARASEESFRVRKKKTKLLPALLWLGLAYTVFHENSVHLGKAAIATETSKRESDREKDFGKFDDPDSREHIDKPADPNFNPKYNDLKNEIENDIEREAIHAPLDIIVVAAVDGTVAGISRETGRVVWKQSSDVTSSPSSSASLMMQPNNFFGGDRSQILKPLVSTTTTTKSAAGAHYKAVPSVDGTIYTTTNEMTITSSVKDLVARSPFLDPKGRFYVGSRYATAAALDSETGQVLRVVPPSGKTFASDDRQSEALPSLEGRNIIWVGRVDHEISVQDAKTGMIEAQFSVGEVMSISDMRGIMGNDGWTPEQVRSSDSSLQSTAVTKAPKGESQLESALIATPNGNVALWNFETDQFDWVSDESFDSPIAYAMDGKTGLMIGVDIIPDVPDPSASMDDLTREMERQSEMVSLTNTPVVGAMLNGQLYALPLRRKRTSSLGKVTNGATAIASTSSVAAAALSGSSGKHTTHLMTPLPGRSNANLHHNDVTNQHHHHQKPDSHGKNGVVVVKKPCLSSSQGFPSCLLETHSEHKILPERIQPSTESHSEQTDLGLVVATTNFQTEEGGFVHPIYGYVSPENLGGFVHPQFGYVSARDLYGSQTRTNKNTNQKLFRVLGSWLPPTIALLFVISFELGRRKRLKDEHKGLHHPFSVTEGKGKSNGVISIEDKLQSRRRSPDRLHRQEVITVSEDVLGYGGHGTVVYKGVLDGRDVAVKRMLKAYHASADREISLLIESDGDPNVVRYFLKEVRGDFVYLALELCDLSLHELIGVLRENLKEKSSLDSSSFNNGTLASQVETVEATRRILLQIASGVKHLHSLRIVHRDLKPANILLAISKRGRKKRKQEGPIFETFIDNYYDAKISDMGLGKQLMGQSSIGASFIGESSYRGNKSGVNSIGVGPGTVGWQAPEVMAMRLASDISARSTDSTSNVGESKECSINDHQPSIRTSRSVDIFSLGCIFYSLLLPGCHPFGEWFEREANIIHNRPNLELLKGISFEAYHLIRAMLERNPRLRPTAKDVCEHPFFWNFQKKLTFMCDFSDRLETDLIAHSALNAFSSLAIERGAVDVVGTSWEPKLDNALIDNVQKFRTYDFSCVRDLLRLIRNKHHHFEELPEVFRTSTIPNQDALCEYFTTRFPSLVMHCFLFCQLNLADHDPLLSKFGISPGKRGIKEVIAAPISVTVEQTVEVTEEGDGKEQTIPKLSNEGSNEDTLLNETEPSSRLETGVSGISDTEVNDDIIVWEGSIAAKTFNCRGWSRSQDEWSRHIEPFYKKRDPALKRCMDDPKFRTRLCNHWDVSLGTFCPMKKKNKCVFAHGPAELRVKEGKKNRWGKLVDKNGNNSNPMHSGGEDTYGAAASIEQVRKEEGKWNSSKDRKKSLGSTPRKKKVVAKNNNQAKLKAAPQTQG